MQLETSKKREIVRLSLEGMRQAAIAATVGCSAVYVHKVLKEEGWRGNANGRYSPLEAADFAWLKAEAARLKSPIEDVARALLIDAIHEAKR